MGDDIRLDDELAAFTDRLLAGEDAPAPPDLEDLAQVVRQLQQVIAPHERPAPGFRERLTQRLTREWPLQHHRRLRPWRASRRVQLTALAASVAVALLVVALLAANTDGSDVKGTASGSVAGPVAVVVVIALGVGLWLIWRYQRRKF